MGRKAVSIDSKKGIICLCMSQHERTSGDKAIFGPKYFQDLTI